MVLTNTTNANSTSFVIDRLKNVYKRLLGQVVQQARAIMLVLVIGALVSVLGFAFMKPTLIPQFKDRNVLIQLTGAAGTSQPEMSRIDSSMSAEGRAILGDQVVNVNSSEIWLSIDPNADYDKTIAAIQEIVNGYPGIKSNVLTYMEDRVSELTATSGNTVSVRIYGDRQDILQREADKVKDELAGINGLADLKVAVPLEEPTLQIKVDLSKAQQYGIKPGDVRRTAAILLSGVQVGNLFEEQKVFDVVVWGTPATRNSITSIEDMLIDTPSGEQVRLGEIADVSIVPVPTAIQHDAVKRYLEITATVKNRDISAVAADIRSRLAAMQFPLEYHAEVLANSSGQYATSSRFYIFIAVAVVMIFLLLQAAYRSWHFALLSFVSVPFGFAGGVLAMIATRGNLTLGSLIGFLVLFEIVSRNSIAMATEFHRLERVQGLPFGTDLIVRVASERLGAILTTAFALALMLVPSLILGDVPGLEIIRPMAVVVLGGLVTATLLNLFVLPALYLRYGANRERDLEILPTTTADVPASAD
jgi:Cu/Ag efflux pump CusA